MDALRAEILRPAHLKHQAAEAARAAWNQANTLNQRLKDGLDGQDIVDLAPISRISLAGLALVEIADIAWQLVSPVLTVVTGGLSNLPALAVKTAQGMAVKKGLTSVAREQIAGRSIETPSAETESASAQVARHVMGLTPVANVERLMDYWRHREDRFGDPKVFAHLSEVRVLLSKLSQKLNKLARSKETRELLDLQHRGYLKEAANALNEADQWLKKYEKRSREAMAKPKPPGQSRPAVPYMGTPTYPAEPRRPAPPARRAADE